MYTLHEVQTDAEKMFGVLVNDEMMTKLSAYKNILFSWNSRMNLTAIRDEEGVFRKHFLDSLAVGASWKGQKAPGTLIDIGTGAGFPGIVLKIAFPEIDVTLVESIAKKATFCSAVITELRLKGCRVVCDRAENLQDKMEYKNQFDVAVARAVAPLGELTKLVMPFVKSEGKFVAMKGVQGENELQLAHDAIKSQVGVFEKNIFYTLPEENFARTLIVIRKLAT